MSGGSLSVVLGVVLMAAAVLAWVALWLGARPARDVGPWRFDDRTPVDGTCRFRSFETGARCIRRDQHRGRHESHDEGVPVTFG